MDIPEHIIDKFRQASVGHIKELEVLLADFAKNPVDKNLWESIRQQFHTYHGAAEMFGYKSVGDLSSLVEALFLERLESGSVFVMAEIDTVITVKNFIRNEVHGDKFKVRSVEALTSELKSYLKD